MTPKGSWRLWRRCIGRVERAALIAGVLHQCRSIAEVVRRLQRDKAVRAICGFPGRDKVPGEDALGRFLKKVVEHRDLLEECFESLAERLRKLLP